jgi:GTP-binding protein
MNINKAELAGTFFTLEQLPADPRPKVLFLGRSNVGKSSLINALLGQRLARTSASPGKTVSVNYYAVDCAFPGLPRGGGRLLIADLPGYGYARVGKSEILRVRRLLTGFLARAENVRLAVLLIDSRHGFLPPDLDTLAQIVEKNLPILTILTKSDKISSSQQRNLIAKLQHQFGLFAIPFSIRSPEGKGEIWQRIREAL